ncbi:MAG TPA: hypothetical protein VM165_17195 [Planctomycetaceae bacterium]|nr:hypothetical protein [Planctomycetaceae bacterium]
MVNPAWRDELHAALVRERLPSAYVARLMDELCDHYHELELENLGMDADLSAIVSARLGHPSQLAATAAVAYRARTFGGRHPVMTFAFAPLGLLLASWIGLCAVHYVIGLATGDWDWPVTLPQLRVATWIATGEVLLPIAVLAALFARFAGRCGVDWRWPLLSTGMLAMMAGLIYFRAFVTDDTQRPAFYVVAGVPFTVQQWLQSAVMAAIGIWFCWRARHRSLATS